MIAQLRRSLGAKILLLAGLNLVLLIAIGLAALGVRVPRSFTQMVMQAAEPRLQDVTRRIALDLERAQPSDADAIIDRYSEEFDTRLVLALNDGTRIAGADLEIPELVKQALSAPRPIGGFEERVGPPISPSGLRLPQTPAHLVRTAVGPRLWVILRTPVRFAGEAETLPGSLLIAPYRLVGDSLLFPLTGLFWVLLAFGVTVICWWPLLRGLTRSLRQIEHATEEIAHGRFDTTVPMSRGDEVGRLSRSIEQMAARLGVLASRQKRFLGDTAHELRSPLGRMHVALELLNRKVDGAERIYVDDLKQDVEALSQLTDELLLYARAELQERGSEQPAVPLRPIVDRLIDKEGSDATIVVDISDDTVVRGDALLLERAIANVIRNAVKYAGTAGPIVVTAIPTGGAVTLSISDAGPGVAPESLTRLFDPFFREDAARNRKTGGTGLGLAIVRSAVEACGGSVGCANRAPHGLEVRMTLQRA